MAHNVIEKGGAWHSYAGERIGQGRDNAKRFLIENPAVAGEVEGKLRALLGLPSHEQASTP